MEAGAPTAAGWKALCGLLYQSLQYAASLRATEQALQWLEGQATAGHEYLGQCALFLKVIHARSLLKLGRVDEAEEEFGVLAGVWLGVGGCCCMVVYIVHWCAWEILGVVCLQ